MRLAKPHQEAVYRCGIESPGIKVFINPIPSFIVIRAVRIGGTCLNFGHSLSRKSTSIFTPIRELVGHDEVAIVGTPLPVPAGRFYQLTRSSVNRNSN